MKKIKELISNHEYALQKNLFLIGVILILVGVLFETLLDWNIPSVILTSIGSALASVPLYDIIVKEIKGLKKDVLQEDYDKIKNDLFDLKTTFEKVAEDSLSDITSLVSEYRSRISYLYGEEQCDVECTGGKSSHILLNEGNIMNFINIGVSSKVISDKYKFKELIKDSKYKGTTVMIIGTWFKPLSLDYGGDSDTLTEIKDALRGGVNFKFVLSDPNSIFLRDADNLNSAEILP